MASSLDELRKERAHIAVLLVAVQRVANVLDADITGSYRGPSEDLAAARELVRTYTQWAMERGL